MKNLKEIIETGYRINLNGKELDYSLKRSSRKTISIIIKNTGQIIVACPLETPLTYIEKVLIRKAGWIVKKLAEIRENPIPVLEKSFDNGDVFYYLGEPYKLKIVRDVGPEICLKDGLMILQIPEAPDRIKIKSFLKHWYISKATELLEQRIKIYSLSIGVSPKKLAVREQKTRWGSCSTKGNINLNWKLIMSPLQVIDYVVVHELCHMKEMNHSRKFWELVECIMPDYKVYKKWLKDNGYTLML